MLFDDTFQTIAAPSEGFFKDKGSKFLSYAFPIAGETDAREKLAALKELHPKAVHHCYAYRLGSDRMSYRMSDDGEPSGTAGRPILNTLYSKDLTNLIVIVVRYFGGTLLGVPGLINAYKTATDSVLESAELVTRHFINRYEIEFQYPQMNDVMRIVKEMELNVLKQHFGIECAMTVEVRVSATEVFVSRCQKIEALKLTLS